MITIKVCGLTSRKDVLYAAKLGVDALGFILAESPRQVTIEKVGSLVEALPPFINIVGVVVNPDEIELQSIIESELFDYLQFHGNEDPALIETVPVKTIKAISLTNPTDLTRITKYNNVDYFLFDSRVEEQFGGTGRTFDWSLINQGSINKPFILAGGLGIDNVVEAIRMVKPAGIDLNSKIEIAPGQKDHHLLKQIISMIRTSEHNLADQERGIL